MADRIPMPIGSLIHHDSLVWIDADVGHTDQNFILFQVVHVQRGFLLDKVLSHDWETYGMALQHTLPRERSDIA